MRASHRASAALAVSAACVILAVAVIVDRTPGMAPVSLEFIKDMDAPNNLDRAIMAHATGVKRSHTNNGVQQQLMQMPRTAPMNLKTALLQQNRQLQKEVGVLENEVQTMSSKMQGISGSRRRARQPQLRGVKALWAQGAARRHIKTQSLEGSRGLSHELEPSSVYFSTSSGDPLGYALSTAAGDDNPIANLQPGDYWKDPYNRPFLHAPYPHDPSSTLAHTVTGDYASPATWGEIYHNKESIDWCVENFPWFEDRIKCIKKIHAEGPLLG